MHFSFKVFWLQIFTIDKCFSSLIYELQRMIVKISFLSAALGGNPLDLNIVYYVLIIHKYSVNN